MDGRLKARRVGRTQVVTDDGTDERTVAPTDGRTHGWMDGNTVGRTQALMDRRSHRLTNEFETKSWRWNSGRPEQRKEIMTYKCTYRWTWYIYIYIYIYISIRKIPFLGQRSMSMLGFGHKRDFCACLWIIMNKIIFHSTKIKNCCSQIFFSNFFFCLKFLIFFFKLLFF